MGRVTPAIVGLALLSLPAAAAAAPAVAPEDVRTFLSAVEAAHEAEDAGALEQLHVAPLREAVRRSVSSLFRERNYFVLTHEIVSSNPEDGGAVELDVVARLRSRAVEESADRVSKRSWHYRLERGEDGVVRAAASRATPRRLLPAGAPWTPEDWTGTVEIVPRTGRLGTPEGRVAVSLAVRLRNASATPTRELVFALHPGVVELAARLPSGELPLERSQAEVDTWWAMLPADVPEGGTLDLALSYALDVVGPEPHGVVGAAGAALFTASGWHPWFAAERIDRPVRASHDLSIVVPAGWTAVAPGVMAGEEKLADGRSSFRWFSSLAGPELAVVAAPFARSETAIGDVVLETWRAKDSSDPGIEELAGHVARSVTFLEGVVGPLPIRRLTLVHAPGSGLHAAPGFLAVADFTGRSELAALRDDAARAARAHREEALLFAAHHVAHVWFVDTLAPAGPGVLALTEGLCDHLAAAWYAAAIDARAPARLRGEILDAAAPMADLDRPLVDAVPDQQGADVLVKGKAHVVLDMYREFAGDARWREGLRAYWTAGRGRATGMADLLGALAGDDGRLRAFCGAWFVGRGFAQLRVATVGPTPDGRAGVVEIANDGAGPLRVKVTMTIAGRREIHDLDVDGDGTAVLTVEGPVPTRVEVDAEALAWQSRWDDDTWPAGTPGEGPRLEPATDARSRWAKERQESSGAKAIERR